MSLIKKIWALPSDAGILIFAVKNKQTPLSLKILITLTFIYILSPFDLIPDIILLAGWLDDLIIVPFVVSFIIKKLPSLVLEEARRKSREYTRKAKLFLLLYAIGFILFLFFLIWLVFY